MKRIAILLSIGPRRTRPWHRITDACGRATSMAAISEADAQAIAAEAYLYSIRSSPWT
jgi:hypothetical protein